MIPPSIRLRIFFKNVWHAVLGILSEILLVAFFVFVGFVVCVFWWGLFR